jgi:hypothetical protein
MIHDACESESTFNVDAFKAKYPTDVAGTLMQEQAKILPQAVQTSPESAEEKAQGHILLEVLEAKTITDERPDFIREIQ